MSHHSHAHSKIELGISCKNLPYSSSNQVIMFVKDSQTQKWISTSHKTEVINSFNPEFITSMIVDYHFVEAQKLRFICRSEQRVIGHYDCSLGSFFSSRYRKRFRNVKIEEKLSLDSNDKSHDATIIISGEEVIDSKNIVTLQIEPHNIAVDEQAPLIISRINENGTYSRVYVQKISSIDSSTFEIEVGERKLCNSDKDRTFRIEVEDHEGVLGACELTLNELLEGNGNNFKRFPLKLPNGMDFEDSKLDIKASLKEKSTFLDYIASGTQINLVIAIDFTESNGDPEDPDSLHYIGDDNKDNDYQQAIRNVGEILEQYDSDKKIPVYGFGADFDESGEVSHAYPLNNNFENPEVRGVNGVMEVYKETMNNVELDGPTNFSPVIKQTSKIIKSEMEINNDLYYILLIITYGIVTDMDATVRSIVRAKELPLSIIIVGVGDDDFTKMKKLDADDKDRPLEMQHHLLPGMMKGRDIVQFIEMREFKSEQGTTNLLKKVMEEIPGQFMSYRDFRSRVYDI